MPTSRRNRAEASPSLDPWGIKQSEEVTEDKSNSSQIVADPSLSSPVSASHLNIDELPDDVLFGILAAAYAHNYPQCHMKKYDLLAHSPVAFSQVSRRLRHVALALPEIWSCVHITPHFIQHSDRNIALQLSRSRSRPLSITFLYRNVSSKEERLHEDDLRWWSAQSTTDSHSKGFKRCWDMLLEHISRWRHLTLSIETDEILRSLLTNAKLASSEAPLLEHMDICLDMHPLKSWRYPTEWQQHITVPCLTHLRIHNGITSPISFAGFSRLTTLVLTGDTFLEMDIHWSIDCVDELKPMLDAAGSTLETLILRRIGLKRPNDAGGAPFSLPRLRHLSMKSVFGVRDWASLLSRFSEGAPELTRLTVALNVFEDVVFPATSASPVFHSLTELELDPITWMSRYGHPGPFISAFPSVRHVSVSRFDEFSVRFLLPVGRNGVPLELESAGMDFRGDYRDVLRGEPKEPWSCLELDTLTLAFDSDSSLQLLLLLMRVRAAIGHPINELVLRVPSAILQDPDRRSVEEEVSVVRFEDIGVDRQFKDRHWNSETGNPTIF